MLELKRKKDVQTTDYFITKKLDDMIMHILGYEYSLTLFITHIVGWHNWIIIATNLGTNEISKESYLEDYKLFWSLEISSAIKK